jgi:ABC-type sulfate/molybdate transport systems ATPase subunit
MKHNGEVVLRQVSLNSHRQPLLRPHQRSVGLLLQSTERF